MPARPTAPLTAIRRAVSTFMENDRRLNAVRRLQKMTDKDLAARGVRRDEIVARVYAPYMYL